MTAPPSAWTIQQIMSVGMSVASRLEQEGTTDEADLIAALREETPDIDRLLLRLVRAAQEARHDQHAIAERAQNLAARKARAARVEESCRGAAFSILDALGLAQWKHPEASLSIRAGAPGLRVTDATLLPPHLVRTTTAPDMAAIKEAVAQGEVVPGVEHTNGLPSLTIRNA